MPGGDRTGPRGLGPRTGRAAGYCAGNDVPGWMSNAPGRGAGFGYGRGRGRGIGFGWGGGGGFGRGGGWRWRTFQPTFDPVDRAADLQATTQALEDQVRRLQAKLDEVTDRVGDLLATKRKVEEEQ